MRTRYLLLFVACLTNCILSATFQVTSAQPPTDNSTTELDAGFEPIFNGKDLSGWAGAIDDYEVVDGAIVCKQGKGGVLYTEANFTNFAVQLEFKLPPGGNNGLAIRYPGHGRASYDGMCELQVLDDTADKYKNLDPRQFHGAVYGIAPAEKGYLKPIGQWNQQLVTVVGSTISVVLNGQEITNADLSKVKEFLNDRAHPGLSLTQGHFGFAGHNDPVMYRNIRIKELPAPESYKIDRKTRNNILNGLVFHATFDDTTDANLSTGDGRVFTAENLKRERVLPGNHIAAVSIAEGQGRFRDAILFKEKTEQVLLYEGIEFGYQPKNWNGTVSFWMKLDPDKDIPPGYCDPIQITQKTWNDGAFFVDFDKDLPRAFRLGVFSDYSFWNPKDTKWDDVPADKRPMVTVQKPPFSSSDWTHVCFTWENLNSDSSANNSQARLYLNGQLQGEIPGPFQFTWDPQKVVIMLGINYVGLMDDLGVFNRALTDEQVRILAEFPMGIGYL